MVTASSENAGGSRDRAGGEALARRALAAGLALVLLFSSKNIGFMDQGDFTRAVGSFLDKPLDLSNGYVWTFRNPLAPPLEYTTSVVVFFLVSLLQKLTGNVFNLYVMAAAAKLVLLAFLYRLSAQLADMLGGQRGVASVLFAVLALSSFYAHNVALFNSFYMEYAFFLFLPVLLIGISRPNGSVPVLLLAGAALLCGGAKTQFFYVPALVLCCVGAVRAFAGRWPQGRLVAGLLLAQALCVVPMLSNPNAAANHYHATFMGSYPVLQDAQLRDLGLSPEMIGCVDVDAWGNRLTEPGGTSFQAGFATCVGLQAITFADVLRPYLRYPRALFDVFAVTLPNHLTVNYFHVDKRLAYIVPANGVSFGLGEWLVRATALRDAATPLMTVIVIALGLVLPMLPARRGNPLRAASLFLALFFLSQLLVVMLGEGVRDFSRHMSAAQFGLDLLVPLCLVQIVLLFGSAEWPAAFRPSR